MSFFFGAIGIICFMIILIFSVPGRDDDWNSELVSNMPIFRFIFMVIFVLAAVAVDIKIFKKFKVNYLFIFELDPNYKMTHIQIFRVRNLLLSYRL